MTTTCKICGKEVFISCLYMRMDGQTGVALRTMHTYHGSKIKTAEWTYVLCLADVEFSDSEQLKAALNDLAFDVLSAPDL